MLNLQERRENCFVTLQSRIEYDLTRSILTLQDIVYLPDGGALARGLPTGSCQACGRSGRKMETGSSLPPGEVELISKYSLKVRLALDKMTTMPSPPGEGIGEATHCQLQLLCQPRHPKHCDGQREGDQPC